MKAENKHGDTHIDAHMHTLVRSGMRGEEETYQGTKPNKYKKMEKKRCHASCRYELQRTGKRGEGTVPVHRERAERR